MPRSVALAAAVAVVPLAGSASASPAPGPDQAPVEVVPICWAVTDDTPEILRFNLSVTHPIPPTAAPLSRVYTGEGMAYRASKHDLMMFSDAPAQMWHYDLESGDETQVGSNLPGHVDAAALWVDPANPTNESLWIVIGALLYKIDPDTAAILAGPHVLPGIGGSSGGLAFEPKTGELWMTDDAPEAALYKISLTDFSATKMVDIRWPDGSRPDSEALDFGAQGQLYTEEDFGDHRGSRYILQIDPVTGIVTQVAGPTPGIGDLEGLGCNGGAEVFKPIDPAIDIEKYVNTHDADEAPGPDIQAGNVAYFKYLVRNTGNLPLRDVTVTDDRGVAVVCPSGTNVIGDLAVGDGVECNGQSPALPELYRNVGDVVGWADPPPQPGDLNPAPIKVTDDDPAHYRGYVWPPPPPSSVPGTDPVPVTTPVPDPDPTYDQPERFISHDSRPPETVQLDITLPETGGRPSSNSTFGAALGLLVGGGVLLGAARPRRRDRSTP